MSIDRDKVRAIRADIDGALAAIAKKHDLSSLKCGNATFTASAFTFKLDGVITGGDDREAITYKQWASLLGLPPLHTKFIHRGGPAEIVGMRVGGPHKSVIFKSGAKLYKVPFQRLPDLMKAEHKEIRIPK